MKEYIVLTITSNVLIFDYRTITKEEKAFVNRNTINKESFYYDLKYFKRNKDSILSKINNVNILRIDRLITFKYAAYIIDYLKINTLVLNFLSTIDASDYELFLNCNDLKIINCYFMSSDFISRFKEKGIQVNLSNKNTISDRFMNAQSSNTKDDFYYKKVITINEEYPELMTDLEEFLKINYKLKAIHLCVYSIDLINSIVDLVSKDESKNVVIFLHQEYDKGNFIVNNFKWLKELSEKCLKEYTCEFRIIYSNSFLKNNLFKQLTFNNLKLIMILCIYISGISLAIYKSYQYIEKMSIASLNSELVDELLEEELPDEQVEFENEEEAYDTSDSDTVDEKKQNINKKYVLENSFKKLKKINKETVAYLTVKNTNIAYPVVQHSDNSYYLKYDIYKRKNYMGWIYLDYRNNVNELNDNSIIYGHNMANGTMFGTLRQVLNSTWRKDEENMIITLDTEKGTYKFKIFSAYKVNYTTDYLVTNFETVKEKEKFIKLIKNRSSFKSKVEVSAEDKILTLSTCTGGNNKRLAVHAVLLKEEVE